MLPVKRFIQFAQEHILFDAGQPILLTVSGGRDSVLMAHFFKQAGLKFGIAHCNFQLRDTEANRDQDFVARLAQILEVPFHVTSFQTAQYAASQGISIQMAARNLRYQWFENIRTEFNYEAIAVAHHQNDTVETILLNLTRGTGIAGLHGILPKSGHIVRPMLFLNRDEVDALVEQAGIDYVEDSSNASTKYARNKIRHEVIPALKAINPALEQTFEHNLQYFKELEVFLNAQLAKLKVELFEQRGDDIYIGVAGLKALNPQKLLLYGLLSPYGFNETTIADLITSFDKHSGRMFQSAAYTLVVDREYIILTPAANKLHLSALLNQAEQKISVGEYQLVQLHDDSALIVRDNPMATSVDADKLVYPLVLRTRVAGDYFYPLGMKGRKLLSDFFIGEKIPLHHKDKIFLLVNGNGDVIWVAGFRLDDRYKVNTNTKKVVIFELNKL